MRAIRVFATFFALTAAAQAQTSMDLIQSSRCPQFDRPVYEIYSDEITSKYRKLKESGARPSFRETLDAMPRVWTPRLADINDFVVGSMPSSDFVFDGYYRPEWHDKDYTLVPFLDIGLDVSPTDVLYFCIDWTPEERNRSITILAMEPTAISKYLSEDKIKYKRKEVSLTFNPVRGVFNLFQRIAKHIPYIDKAYERFNDQIQKAAVVVDFAWLLVRKFTLNLGVSEVVIRPNQMDMMYQVRLLNYVKLGPRKHHSRPIQALILQDKYYDEDGVEVPEPKR